MARVLIYKTADNIIAICRPIPKEIVQRDLKRHDKHQWVGMHEQAGKHEVSRGMSRAHHDKRIAWASRVKDFNNLTDDEFEALIHTATPDDHQYHFWIDESLLPVDRTYRDAWVDMNDQGVVTLDPEKVKQIDSLRIK